MAEPRVIGGGELPTRQEWLDEQARKNAGNKKTSTKFGSTKDKNKVMQGRK